jgi:protein involved in polysaccharide export with SLBB domain
MLMADPPIVTDKEGIVIPNDGKISFYSAHNVQAAGRTREELANALEEGIKKYINNPEVTVNLIASSTNYVTINGAVGRPGQFVFRRGLTFFEVLSSAGGTVNTAAKEALIYRKSSDGKPQFLRVDLIKLFEGDASQDIPLQIGDQVVVNEAVVRVSGEVSSQGIFPLRNTDTVGKALIACGGLSTQADLEHAFILRGQAVVPIDLRPITKGTDGVSTSLIPLQDGDILTVPALQQRVTVMGDVSTGPIYLIPNSQDKLTDVLAKVGASSRATDFVHVQLIRFINGNPVRTVLNVGPDGPPSDNVILQNGDVIYLLSKKEKNKQDALLTATLLTQLLGAVRNF